MKLQMVSLAVSVAGMLGISAAEACDPPVRVVRRTSVVVVKPCAVVKPCVVVQPCVEEVVELQTLIRLQLPVHVRVQKCCDELAAAKAAVAAAIAARDAAAATETGALDRVEAAACLLKTMGSCIEVNGCVYSKEDVAAAVEVLISRYHTASAALAAAGELVALRTAELAQVEARVAKWQRKEQELLEQVASLRATREVSVVSVKQVAAAKLASELHGMLNQAPAKVLTVGVETTTETTTVTKPDSATATSPDQLLQEVDQILQQKSGG